MHEQAHIGTLAIIVEDINQGTRCLIHFSVFGRMNGFFGRPYVEVSCS